MGMRVGQWYVVTSFWAVRVLDCYPLILPFSGLLFMNILSCFRKIRLFGVDFLKRFQASKCSWNTHIIWPKYMSGWPYISEKESRESLKT